MTMSTHPTEKVLAAPEELDIVIASSTVGSSNRRQYGYATPVPPPGGQS